MFHFPQFFIGKIASKFKICRFQTSSFVFVSSQVISLIHSSARNGHLDVVRALVEAGADKNKASGAVSASMELVTLW